MSYVHHPSGKAAREIVAGRIVRFDDAGVAEVTVPHLLARYAAADGYVVSKDRDGARVAEAGLDPVYAIECPQCGAQPGEFCRTGDEPRLEPHTRRVTAAGTDATD